MPDRLAQHARDDALRSPLHQLQGERAADAVAHEEELADAQMVHQPQLVVRECAPWVVDRDRAGGFAMLALRWSIVMQRKSFLNTSITLKTAVGQLLIREFKPPPGVASSGKPLPTSS